MGLINKLFGNEEKKEELTPVVDNNERGAADPESSAPVEEPAVEEPVVEEPVAEEPAVEEPVVEEPVAEEPRAEDAQNPVYDPDSNEKNPKTPSFL